MIARLLASLMLLGTTAALSPDDLAKAVARPPADAHLPALRFTDASGHRVTLGDVAANHPLVLVFADYTCRNVCAPGLMLTANALAHTGFRAGADYRVAILGLDPKDSAADARAMTAKMAIAPAVAHATTILLGDARATPAAAKALGYGYVYDPDADQFAHDAAVYVFAPDGQLSAVLPELSLIPTTMRTALTGAASPSSFADRVAHLCYGFAAAHGRYGRPVVLTMQLLSIALLLGFGVFLLRRRRPA